MLYFVGKCDYLGERTPLLEHRNKAHYRAAEFVLRIESAKLGERLSLAFGIFAVVLNQSGGGSDTESLVKGMTEMHFSGVAGDIYLDEKGDAIKPVVVNTYEDGAIKWLETITPEE